MSDETGKAEKQTNAEADVDGFRQDRGPFVVAAEATRMPMVFTNAKASGNPIIFANDSFLDLTGYGREEVLGQGFNFLMTRGIQAEGLALLDAAFDGRSDTDPEIHYRRKDGSEFWASVFVTPVQNQAGQVVQHFASFADNTHNKKEQARTKILIDELNHRVKTPL